MADKDVAYDGPLPPGRAARRAPTRARRPAPVPQQATAEPIAPPQPPSKPLQTFIPRLNRYVQAKVSKSSGEVGAGGIGTKVPFWQTFQTK